MSSNSRPAGATNPTTLGEIKGSSAPPLSMAIAGAKAVAFFERVLAWFVLLLIVLVTLYSVLISHVRWQEGAAKIGVTLLFFIAWRLLRIQAVLDR